MNIASIFSLHKQPQDDAPPNTGDAADPSGADPSTGADPAGAGGQDDDNSDTDATADGVDADGADASGADADGADAAGDTAAADSEWMWEEHEGSYFFPEQASEFAPTIDTLYDVIFWISLLFFVIIVGVMIWFVIAYRKRPGYVPQKSPSHNTMLEVAWSVLPSLILVYFFVAGVWGFMDMRVPPDETYTINVYARQWSFRFVYPDGEESTVLHIPKNTPVKFQMQSEDVLHAWYVPAFRQKWDIIPGRYAYTWVNATEEGEYRLYCAEYCGDGHSTMRTHVVVHDLGWNEMMDKIRWKYNEHTDLENGERLFLLKGCAGCHTIDGTTKTGPTFLDQYGEERDITGGDSVVMDDAYIQESIWDPQKKIRAGYPNQMPVFRGQVSLDEIRYLTTYIKSLKSN